MPGNSSLTSRKPDSYNIPPEYSDVRPSGRTGTGRDHNMDNDKILEILLNRSERMDEHLGRIDEKLCDIKSDMSDKYVSQNRFMTTIIITVVLGLVAGVITLVTSLT